MTKHHNQLHTEMLNSILNAPDGDIINYVAGAPHHEQVANALIKQNLRGYARIGTPNNDGKRVLPLGNFAATLRGAMNR
jgi:hypothetical protein